MKRKSKDQEVAFEEALQDDWSRDLEVVEVPLGNRPLIYLSFLIVLTGALLLGRILFLNLGRGELYRARAEANLSDVEKQQAPRGLIYDREGKILAENEPVFVALFDMREFLRHEELREETLKTIQQVLNLDIGDVIELVEGSDPDRFADAVVLHPDLTQSQVIQLRALNLSTLFVEQGFKRGYPEGEVFSSVVGYVGRVSAEDLKTREGLGSQDLVGKSGIELFYDEALRGEPGVVLRRRDARGQVVEKELKSDPKIGSPLHLTIDGELQSYVYRRLQDGLWSLGRQIGVAVAMNPQNGEILALVNLPSFDNNIFSGVGRSEERAQILTSTLRPLFNRAVSGFYNPGSTIKPLVGVAALKDGVITPEREIFSPGYLDVPNPYDPERPTRFLDWRYQGNVDLSAAIAQSSNVYFYSVGGGTEEMQGLGISRLREWWEKFGLGQSTDIDFPHEAAGFLPTPEWKEEKIGTPWLLGDTYNVSIGQGDILATPLQILNFVSAIGNGGKLYKPVVNRNRSHPELIRDLSYLGSELQEIQKGMREAVTAPLGTANLLSDLGFSVGAKTGTAQVRANTEENAFFVGYAPSDKPEIAILVLVENAREGSLNAVPIAKDILNWYYWNRIRK
ncbi:penicillin-binding protein 2 [Candidatus Parcubacteria bacterium]|nr:MAG: penicillin-binding protein 2 [Candidatus Parcubacteria bacterium]